MESVPISKIERLSEIATKSAESLGLQLLRLTARGTPSRAIIEVTLDGSKLVSIGDCETVSRCLNDAIESESLIGGNFRLDVLSPGLDEPIVHDYQFQRTIGHLVEVIYEEDGKKQTVLGTLKDALCEDIILVKKHLKRSNKTLVEEIMHIKKSQIVSAYSRPDFG